MNAFDLFVLIAVLVAGTAWGFFKGALRQVLDAIALVGAVLVSWVLSGTVSTHLGDGLKSSYPATLLFVSLALFFVAYVVIKLLWSIPVRFLEKKGQDGAVVLSAGNRVIGGGLGTVRMLLLTWVVLSVAAVVQGRIAEAKAAVLRGVAATNGKAGAKDAASAEQKAQGDSVVYEFVASHNFFDVLFHDRLVQLQQLVTDLTAGKKRAVDGFDTLASDARVQAVVKDPSVKKALETGDLAAVASNPAVVALVADAEIMGRISAALEAAVVEGKGGAAHGADKAREAADKAKAAAAQAAAEAEKAAGAAAAELGKAAEDVKNGLENAAGTVTEPAPK